MNAAWVVGHNMPTVSGGVTYADGGGEVKNNRWTIMDRPEGDHSHDSRDIVGLPIR